MSVGSVALAMPMQPTDPKKKIHINLELENSLPMWNIKSRVLARVAGKYGAKRRGGRRHGRWPHNLTGLSTHRT